MNRHPSYPFSFCTICQHTGEVCEASYMFAVTLAQTIGQAHAIVGDDFAASGFAELKGCDRPCTVGWHCSKSETFIFGDLDTKCDLDDLVCLAKSILPSTPNGKGPQKPTAIPAFMLALETQCLLRSAA